MASQYIHNHRQGAYKRILCVCSLGLIRSPTLAFVLSSKGHNTRSCGTDIHNALIPISENLIEWADEIVFLNRQNYDTVAHMVDKDKVKILDIPDDYDYREGKLIDICNTAYGK